MSKLHVAALVALCAAGPAASTAFAQAIFRPGAGAADRSIHGRVTDDDVYTCAAAPGGSRVRANCEVETETATFEMQQRLKIALKPPPLPGEQCGATTTTQYQQRDTVARVNGTLHITDCALASGAFTVAVRVKDESGAETPLEFHETWERSGGADDVAFTADYPIGENTELVNVRLRGLSCTCSEAAAAPASPPDADAPAPAADPGQSQL